MKYYVVDSFADEVFKGNPAGVCVLDGEIASELMQNIAMENNLSETAFTYKVGERYKLRWFTPGFEINLCGHATLATAYVIFEFVEPKRKIVEFETLSGVLTVERKGELYEMSFPKLMPEKIAVTDDMIAALGVAPVEAYSERDLYVVLENEEAVKAFVPDYAKLCTLEKWLGIVVTAKGGDSDFVSRYFCPELDLEDPVTGSSHSSLVPLWSAKLGKDIMVAKQLSKRGGVLYCENSADRVKISGRAALYMRGEIKGKIFQKFIVH